MSARRKVTLSGSQGATSAAAASSASCDAGRRASSSTTRVTPRSKAPNRRPTSPWPHAKLRAVGRERSCLSELQARMRKQTARCDALNDGGAAHAAADAVEELERLH